MNNINFFRNILNICFHSVLYTVKIALLEKRNVSFAIYLSRMKKYIHWFGKVIMQIYINMNFFQNILMYISTKKAFQFSFIFLFWRKIYWFEKIIIQIYINMNFFQNILNKYFHYVFYSVKIVSFKGRNDLFPFIFHIQLVMHSQYIKKSSDSIFFQTLRRMSLEETVKEKR